MKKLLLILSLILTLALILVGCGGGGDDEKNVASISVVEGTVTLEYQVGDTPDFSGIKVLVKYDDGTEETLSADKVTVSTLDTSTAGAKKVTVTYSGVSVSLDVIVNEKPTEQVTLTSIEINESSIVSTITAGDQLNLSTLTVLATYSDGTSKLIDYSSLEVSAVDTTTPGNKTLTVTYGGKSDSMTIKVNGITGITVATGSIKNQVYVGDSYSTQGLEIIVSFSDAPDIVVKASDLDANLIIGNIDTTTAGEKNLQIKYKTFTLDYKVAVVGIKSITINQGSYPESVMVLSTPDFSTVTAKVTYDNGDEKAISYSDLTVTPPSTAAAKADAKLTVSYRGATAEATVPVIGVKSIEVNNLTTEILVGQTLDTSNANLSIVYTNDKPTTVSAGFTFGTIDSSTKGTKKLSVTYLDKTVEIDITVCGIAKLDVTGVPTKVDLKGTHNLSEIEASLVYTNNERIPVSKDNLVITNIDTNTIGDQTFKVEYTDAYEGKFEFTATVKVVGVLEISINDNTYDAYVRAGSNIDTSNVKITVTYNDGTAKENVVPTTVSANANGVITATYTEKGITATATATVKILNASAISVSGLNQTVTIGTDLSTANVKVTVTYKDGETVIFTDIVDYNSDMSISGFDKTSAGDQTVTLTYLGKTATATVHVRAIASIEIVTGTYDVYVKAGTAINTANVKINVAYTDGKGAQTGIAPTTVSVDGGVITATYTENGVTKTDTANVTICSPIGIIAENVPLYIPSTNDINEVNAALSAMKVYLVYAAETGLTKDEVSAFTTNSEELDFSEENKTLNLVVYYEDFESEAYQISTSEPVLESIRIDDWQKLLAHNYDYDYSKLKVVAVYGNGRNENLSIEDVEYTTINNATVGIQTITVTYNGKEATVSVKVLALDSIIYVSGLAEKITIGEELTANNVTVKAIYAEGDDSLEYTVTVTASLSNFDKNTAGNQTVVLTYLGKNAAAIVHVRAIASIEIVAGTYVEYAREGSAINTDNVKINVTYTDGEGAKLNVTPSAVSVDANGVITATYTENGVTKTATATVKVLTASEISVSGLSQTVTIGTDLSTANVKVTVTYKDGEVVIFTDRDIAFSAAMSISGFDKNTAGDQTVTLTYLGKTATAGVHVRAISSIEIIGSYDPYIKAGGSLNTDGIRINVVYTDGVNNKYNILPTSVAANNSTGEITVTYNDGVTPTVTKTETKFKVLPISSIAYVSGLPEKVNVGDTLGNRVITISVTYTDGSSDKIVETVTVNANAVEGFNSSAADTVTLKINYLGKSCNYSLVVRGVASISILSGSVDTVLRRGYTIDTSNLKIEITYTNGDVETITPEASCISTANNILTVTYKGATATMTPKVLDIAEAHAINGTVPSTVIKGESLNYDDMRLTVIYGERMEWEGMVWYENTHTYLISNKDPNLTIVELKTDVIGEKAVTFLLNGYNPVLQNETDPDPVYARIVVIEITSIEVVHGTIQTTLNKGQSLDLSELVIKVTYSDGSSIQTSNKLGGSNTITTNSDEIDTTVEGAYTLKITYSDATINVTINVIDIIGDDNLIVGVTLPDNIVARDGYKEKFNIKDEIYVVGDDNPFIFYLEVAVLDKNDNIIETNGNLLNYNFALYDSNGNRLTGDALRTVLNKAEDDTTPYFDFEQAAVGQIFTLAITPVDYVGNDGTRTHTFKVVDAYNVYEAWELNLMSNGLDWITGDGFDNEGNALQQRNLVTEFLITKGITNPMAISDNLKGIVLHGNINVTTNDIPAKYLYTYTNKNGVTKAEFYDKINIFNRHLSDANPTFTIHGNYYSIFSYSLPCIIENGFHPTSTDNFSGADLIRFNYNSSKADFNHKNYKATVNNLAFRDNDPHSNDTSASERHMRGLVCIKTSFNETKIYNTNIDAYYISMVPESDDLTVNLDYVKFYNSWQGHIFAWNTNWMEAIYYGSSEAANEAVQANGEKPHANYQPIQINIRHSLLGKCGGPVILSQSGSKEEIRNSLSGANVTVDTHSELYSYVTGQEAWFVAVAQTATAGQILALDAPVSGTATGMGYSATYLSNEKIAGVNTMNMIMVSMGDGFGFEDKGYRGSYTVVDDDGNPITVGLNMNDNDQLNTYKTDSSSAGNPIFQTSTGEMFYYGQIEGYPNGGHGVYKIPSEIELDGAAGLYAVEPTNYQGDYITLYMMGMGIMLEYYHP